MSFRVADAVRNSALRPHLRFTALVLADFANDEGNSIYPRIETICRLTGKQRRAIQNNLGDLIEMGVLTVRGSRKGGSGKSTHYRLNVNALPMEDDSGTQRVDLTAPFATAPGRSADPEERDGMIQRVHSKTERVHSSHETVHPDAPDPLDPSESQRTKPSPERRPIRGGKDNGKEQLSDVPTTVRDRQGHTPDSSNAMRDRGNGADQDGGGTRSAAVQHGDGVEGDERRSACPRSHDDDRQHAATNQPTPTREGERDRTAESVECISVAERILAKLKEQGSPVAEQLERQRNARESANAARKGN